MTYSFAPSVGSQAESPPAARRRPRQSRCGMFRRHGRRRGAAMPEPPLAEPDVRAARLSRAFLRFSIFFSFSSMRTVMNFITRSATRRRRSTSFTSSGVRAELDQHVQAFAVLLHAVGQLAHAPLIDFVDRAFAGGDHLLDLFDEAVDLLFRRIRLHDEQLFVDSHSSSLFKPWARRLKIVMDFSTPSAIMDSTAAAPRADQLLHFLLLRPLERREHKLRSIHRDGPGWIPRRTRAISLVPRLPITLSMPLCPAAEPFGLIRSDAPRQIQLVVHHNQTIRLSIRTARASPSPPGRSDS